MGKEVYASFFVEQRNTDPTMYDEIEDGTESYDFGGKYFVIPVELSGGESLGAIREGGLLPGGVNGSIPLDGVQAKVYPKLIYMTHALTGLDIAALQKGPKAFFNSMDRAISQKTKFVRNDIARQFHGTGRGILGGGGTASTGGDILSCTNATPSVVQFGPKTNMNHFAKSMRVEFWVGSTMQTRHNGPGTANQTAEDQGADISEVRRAAKQIVLAQNFGAADAVVAGDVCVREGACNSGLSTGIGAGEGQEITGLQQLVQDGNTTLNLQSIVLGTYSDYKATVDTNGGIDRDITLDLLQKTSDEINSLSGTDPNWVVMGYGQQRKLMAIGLADVRHLSEKLRLGFTEMTWNGKSFYIDRMAFNGQITLGRKDQLCRMKVKEWGSLDHVRGGQRVTRKDAYELAWGEYGNLAIKRTNAFARIGDLAEP